MAPVVSVDVDERARLVAASNAAFFVRVAEQSPGGRSLRQGTVLAGVVPVAPERPVMNSVFVLEPGALDEAIYQTVSGAYRDGGVRGWTVWIDPADERSRKVLSAHGHNLDATPRSMWAEAPAVGGRPVLAGDLEAATGTAVLAELNDAVYGYPGSFSRAVGAAPAGHLEAYVVRAGGRPVAAGAAIEAGGDCHITMMATLPEHRGLGLASGIIRHLVADAVARGCTTTTLVATKAGAPVYEKLGYRDVGHMQMWERLDL